MRAPRKLTTMQVRFIRDCYRIMRGRRRRGMRARLAAKFKVSVQLINAIAAGEKRRLVYPRGKKKRKRMSKAHALKTHCPQGHPYAGDNIYQLPYVKKDGSIGFKRQCRICKNRSHGPRKPPSSGGTST